MRKVIITVAPTGSIPTRKDTPHLPITPDEVAAETLRARDAGAAVVHLHARDPETGAPTNDTAVYAAYLLNVFHPRRPERLRYPEDVLSLARYHVRHREWEPARQCLEDAERFALGPELEVEYHRLSAYLHKRRSDFERALPHLRALAEHLQADSIGALEDLAKYYEHRRRELGEALRLVDRAIALADRALMFGTIAAEPRLAGLYHRRARLRRKLLPKRTG